MKKNWIRILPAVVLFFLVFSPPAAAERERTDNSYFTMVDEDGRVICRTAHYMSVGDEYLTAGNKLYRVRRVEQNTAHARLVEEINPRLRRQSLFLEIRRGLTLLFRGGSRPAQGEEGAEERPVAIYHTHSGESYLPSDGQAEDIEGNGGVIKVGERMAGRLRQENVPVIHDRTSHDPKDAMSYDRSRRTVIELLKKRPIALLDLHRDAVPAEEYEQWVEGEKVAKVQFVVGRQNPNRAASDAFTRQVKAAVDREYPGLVKGIFYGDGKYNQDLAPRILLVEMGAHTNEREAAEKGAEYFAAAAHRVLTVGAATDRPLAAGAWRALLWIAGLAAAGVVIFMLLNKGWGKIREELGGWSNKGGGGPAGSEDETTPDSASPGEE